MTFPDDMEVDRDINCPHPGYPSLLEGQLQLGLSRRELKDIYVSSLPSATLSTIVFH